LETSCDIDSRTPNFLKSVRTFQPVQKGAMANAVYQYFALVSLRDQSEDLINRSLSVTRYSRPVGWNNWRGPSATAFDNASIVRSRFWGLFPKKSPGLSEMLAIVPLNGTDVRSDPFNLSRHIS
jgi:hypothetical protein